MQSAVLVSLLLSTLLSPLLLSTGTAAALSLGFNAGRNGDLDMPLFGSGGSGGRLGPVTNDIDYHTTIRRYLQETSGPNGCRTLRKRVEWRDLTRDQRRGWVKAHWCLVKTPSVLLSTQSNLTGAHTSLYSDFTLVHVTLFKVIHFVPAFLPWHRWFLIAREVAMRQCGYDGPMPYWDWSFDADRGPLVNSPVLNNEEGIGGDGSRALNGVVTSGPFAYFPLDYRTLEGTETVPVRQPHYLNRTFGGSLAPNYTSPRSPYPMAEDAYNSEAVQRVLLTNPSFRDFSPALEGLRDRLDAVGMGPHSAIHRAFGGEMPEAHSANDPVFMLHHANVDRLWALWQRNLDLRHTRTLGGGRSRADSGARGGPLVYPSSSSAALELGEADGRLYDYGGDTLKRNSSSTSATQRPGGPQASLNDVQSLLGLLLPNIETYKVMDTTRPPLCYVYV